jgi:hypothetical protein
MSCGRGRRLFSFEHRNPWQISDVRDAWPSPFNIRSSPAPWSFIADEAHWTRGALARDERGRACYRDSREAVRFCAVGALARAAADLLGSTINGGSLAAATAKEVLVANGATRCLQQINDIEGHAAAVRAFQRALE